MGYHRCKIFFKIGGCDSFIAAISHERGQVKSYKIVKTLPGPLIILHDSVKKFFDTNTETNIHSVIYIIKYFRWSKFVSDNDLL